MREAPLRQDRAAARDDAGHAARGHRDVAQQHAGVHGEVVDALLALLDQRVAIDLPGEVLRAAADLLERLIDRHGADRHRRVADDPLARLVDVLAGREVHHRVGAPQRRPLQLLDFVLDRRAHGGVADVGVDLHQEVAADDHRLELEVIDVRRDDGAAARDLGAHEFGGQPFAGGDELHLRRDLAAARVVELRADVAGRAARGDPRLAQLRQAVAHVVPLRTAGVVEAHRRLAAAQRHLAHRHAQRDSLAVRRQRNRPLVVDLAGIGIRRREIDHRSLLFLFGAGIGGGCGRDRGRRAPSAGFNRVRFQGFVSIPARANARAIQTLGDTPGGRLGLYLSITR